MSDNNAFDNNYNTLFQTDLKRARGGGVSYWT